jgi:hypothetical protein
VAREVRHSHHACRVEDEHADPGDARGRAAALREASAALDAMAREHAADAFDAGRSVALWLGPGRGVHPARTLAEWDALALLARGRAGRR